MSTSTESPLRSVGAMLSDGIANGSATHARSAVAVSTTSATRRPIVSHRRLAPAAAAAVRGLACAGATIAGGRPSRRSFMGAAR